MRPREDYTRHVFAALLLTLAILGAFELYVLREPARIATVEARDKELAVSAGQALYTKSCGACHGSDGEGDVGPALNDKTFLNTTADETIFSLISSGVPGSEMPAWNQVHGGPLTDEEVDQLVAYLRSWEPNAPDRQANPPPGNAGQGAALYANICVVCHGENGQGTDRAPALNDPEKLQQFDDAWYRDTIAQGRAAQGMPTWGTVLSPKQINDLVALLSTWRQSGAAPAPVSP